MTEQMQDHWWFRPGWGVGRRFYTWHLTFGGQHELHRLATDYRKALAPLPGLDLIPDQWLHLTMQGLGFTDEVDPADVEAIAAGARARLADVEPFDLVFTTPVITPEAILWAVDPAGPGAVREAIRAAIGDVWDEVPERADGFRAHVSIAYSNATGDSAPIQAALDQVDAGPATVRIAATQLIVLNRDHRMYEWTTYADARLGT